MTAVLAHADARTQPGDAALHAEAERRLHRALPVDAWFLFVAAEDGRLRVTGLDRTGGVATRARAALAGLPAEVVLSRGDAWRAWE